MIALVAERKGNRAELVFLDSWIHLEPDQKFIRCNVNGEGLLFRIQAWKHVMSAEEAEQFFKIQRRKFWSNSELYDLMVEELENLLMAFRKKAPKEFIRAQIQYIQSWSPETFQRVIQLDDVDYAVKQMVLEVLK